MEITLYRVPALTYEEEKEDLFEVLMRKDEFDQLNYYFKLFITSNTIEQINFHCKKHFYPSFRRFLDRWLKILMRKKERVLDEESFLSYEKFKENFKEEIFKFFLKMDELISVRTMHKLTKTEDWLFHAVFLLDIYKMFIY